MSRGNDVGIGALAAGTVSRLRATGATLAVAESCTGGWLGAALTSVPGASDVFWGGVIAYDNEAKKRLLAVDADVLQEHGAVSEPVAGDMARGIRGAANTTWGLAITGVAGPAGGSDRAPVGKVFIALSGPTGQSRELQLSGDREAIRRQSVAAALSLLSSAIGGDD